MQRPAVSGAIFDNNRTCSTWRRVLTNARQSSPRSYETQWRAFFMRCRTGSVDGRQGHRVVGELLLYVGAADIDRRLGAIGAGAYDARSLFHAIEIEIGAGEAGQNGALFQAPLGRDVADLRLAAVAQDAREAGGQQQVKHRAIHLGPIAIIQVCNSQIKELLHCQETVTRLAESPPLS